MTQTTDPGFPPRKGGLTADKFEVLLLRLDPDRDRAGEKYEEIRWKLIKFFQWSSCFEAEDLVDETLDRVAGKLAEEREIIDVTGFAWGVAKKIRQEALRLRLRTVHFSGLPHAGDALAKTQAAEGAQAEMSAGEARLRCLRHCMQHLSADDRRLLLAYHSPKGRHSEGHQRLAEKLGISRVNLRVRANRLRFKLERCIAKCLALREAR